MSAEIGSALWLSVVVAVAATVLNAVVGIPLAYVLARRRFPGRGLVDLMVTLPLVLPPTVTGYYLIVLLGRRGVLGGPLYAMGGWTIAFTPLAAVIAATVMALPLLVRTARAAIESVDGDLERAAQFAAFLVPIVREHGLPRDVLLNVNVPAAKIQGVQITRLGERVYHDELVARLDPRGRPYYWIGGGIPSGVPGDGTDVGALHRGYISVTPIQMDMTAYQIMDTLKDWPLTKDEG